jgi:hypothetical protein
MAMRRSWQKWVNLGFEMTGHIKLTSLTTARTLWDIHRIPK